MYNRTALFFYREKVRAKYDCYIEVQATKRDIDNFVSTFNYNVFKNNSVEITHIEIRKIYIDTREKNRLWVEYVETDKEKSEQAVLCNSIKIKNFDYYV